MSVETTRLSPRGLQIPPEILAGRASSAALMAFDAGGRYVLLGFQDQDHVALADLEQLEVRGLQREGLELAELAAHPREARFALRSDGPLVLECSPERDGLRAVCRMDDVDAVGYDEGGDLILLIDHGFQEYELLRWRIVGGRSEPRTWARRTGLEPGFGVRLSGRVRWLHGLHDQDGSLDVWPLPKGEATRIEQRGNSLELRGVSADGRRALVQDRDEDLILLYELPSGQLLGQGVNEGLEEIVLSPDGQWVAAARGRDLLLWEASHLEAAPRHWSVGRHSPGAELRLAFDGAARSLACWSGELVQAWPLEQLQALEPQLVSSAEEQEAGRESLRYLGRATKVLAGSSEPELVTLSELRLGARDDEEGADLRVQALLSGQTGRPLTVERCSLRMLARNGALLAHDESYSELTFQESQELHLDLCLGPEVFGSTDCFELVAEISTEFRCRLGRSTLRLQGEGWELVDWEAQPPSPGAPRLEFELALRGHRGGATLSWSARELSEGRLRSGTLVAVLRDSAGEVLTRGQSSLWAASARRFFGSLELSLPSAALGRAHSIELGLRGRSRVGARLGVWRLTDGGGR